jgi:hypothetical protein
MALIWILLALWLALGRIITGAALPAARRPRRLWGERPAAEPPAVTKEV